MEERESSTIGALLPPEGKLLTLFPPLPTQMSAIINEELEVPPTEADKSDCPCCGSHLTNDQLFPNFLLNKLLKKASVRQAPKNASPVEQFRRSLLQVGSADHHIHYYDLRIVSQPVHVFGGHHRFGSPDDDADDDAGAYFISVVCLKNDSPTLLTANSQGTIKVLVLAA